ncbi:MAG: DUF1653 domain-containing protein [Patescibacteria group bacterium]
MKLGKYKHYKGNYYEVIGLARDSNTFEDLVVYKGLYDSKEFGKNPLWVRPKKEFLEKVIINNREMPRFEYIEEE